MNVLVIGATSVIMQHVIRRFATEGATLFLVAHNPSTLDAVVSDARVRGAIVSKTEIFDGENLASVERCMNAIQEWNCHFDFILIAHGSLGDHQLLEVSISDAKNNFIINGVSTCLFALFIANILEKQGHGCLTVISSVAALRGRSKNYIYGSGKAMAHTLLQGLRQRFHNTPIRIMTILPGMVDTPMTSHLKKNLLFADPKHVADDIFNSLKNNKITILFTPWYWKPLMSIITHIPEKIFNKLSF